MNGRPHNFSWVTTSTFCLFQVANADDHAHNQAGGNGNRAMRNSKNVFSCVQQVTIILSLSPRKYQLIAGLLTMQCKWTFTKRFTLTTP